MILGPLPAPGGQSSPAAAGSRMSLGEMAAADFDEFDQSVSVAQGRQSMVFSSDETTLGNPEGLMHSLESSAASGQQPHVQFNPFRDWRSPFSA